MKLKPGLTTGSLRLTDFNRKISSIIPVWLLTIVVFGVAVSLFITPLIAGDKLTAPPEAGDGPDYEAIALQVSKGNGFSVDWDDQDYRIPYQANNESGQYSYLFDRHGESATTLRPPLLPAIMAVTYQVFGRQFWAMRVLNIVSMALACAVAIAMLSSRFGVLPGIIGTLWFLVLDSRSGIYASEIMTESIAALTVIVTAWLMVQTVERRNWKWAVGLGVMMGIAFLARTVFLLWTPLIALFSYLLAKPHAVSWRSRSAFLLPSVFLASFLIVSMPWMLRNSIVLRSFEPMGTMGSIQLSAAYSTMALERQGRWFSLAQAGFFDHLDMRDKTPLEREILRADYSKQQAIHWVMQNPSKLPVLIYYRMIDLWKPQGTIQFLLLVFAAIGCLAWLLGEPRNSLALLSLLAAGTLAVGVTWSVGERFLVPMLPVITLFASLGTWSFLVLPESMWYPKRTT